MAYPPDQHPIVLQIGGSNLENLAKATKLADAYGYDEINFKLVCFLPSKILKYHCYFEIFDRSIYLFFNVLQLWLP